jgi:hypothetical protein
MYTIVETDSFRRLVSDYWDDRELQEFIGWLAVNPDFGSVVPGTGGVRKVRWTHAGSGKRGGVRVIYYTKIEFGEIWLLTLYAKSAKDTIPNHILNSIRQAIEQ